MFPSIAAVQIETEHSNLAETHIIVSLNTNNVVLDYKV